MGPLSTEDTLSPATLRLPAQLLRLGTGSTLRLSEHLQTCPRSPWRKKDTGVSLGL